MNNVNMLDILTYTSIFKGLSQEKLEDISNHLCTEITFIEGDEIATQGRQDNNNLYLLYSGNLEVVSLNNSNIEIILNKKEPELAGEIAWILGRKRSRTLRCISEVNALMIDANAFTKWIENDSTTGFIIMKNLAQFLARRLLDKEMIIGE